MKQALQWARREVIADHRVECRGRPAARDVSEEETSVFNPNLQISKSPKISLSCYHISASTTQTFMLIIIIIISTTLPPADLQPPHISIPHPVTSALTSEMRRRPLCKCSRPNGISPRVPSPRDPRLNMAITLPCKPDHPKGSDSVHSFGSYLYLNQLQRRKPHLTSACRRPFRRGYVLYHRLLFSTYTTLDYYTQYQSVRLILSRDQEHSVSFPRLFLLCFLLPSLQNIYIHIHTYISRSASTSEVLPRGVPQHHIARMPAA
jgi:hypothetical protein